MKKLENLLNKYKDLEVQDLPFTSEELLNKVNSRQSKTLRKKYGNLFINKGRFKMMLYSAIVAVLGAFVYFTGFNGGEPARVNNMTEHVIPVDNSISGKVNHEAVASNENDAQTGIANKEQKENPDEKSEKKKVSKKPMNGYSIRTEDKVKESEDYNWDEIEFDAIANQFYGHCKLNNYKKAKHEKSFIILNVPIKTEDLIRHLKNLKKDLEYYNLPYINSIGYVEDPRDFEKEIDEMVRKAKAVSKDKKVEDKIRIYSLIARKLSINTSGFKSLKLTPEELKGLGITVTDSSYTFNSEELLFHPDSSYAAMLSGYGYDFKNNEMQLVKYRNTIKWWKNKYAKIKGAAFSIGSRNPKNNPEYSFYVSGGRKPMTYEGWGLNDYSNVNPVFEGRSFNTDVMDISPILYSNDKSNSKELVTEIIDLRDLMNEVKKIDRSSDEFKQKKETYDSLIKRVYLNQYKLSVNYLLPLKLRCPAKIESDSEEHVIKYLWYAPTEEFLSALPDRYEKPLRNEISIMKALEAGELNIYDACKGLENQESYYNICNLSSDDIAELKIFPNPATNAAKCEFMLTDDRFVKITVNDVNGNFVKEVTDWESMAPGIKTISLNLSGLAPGMYLLMVNTDKGDKVLRRFIKQ